MLEFITRMGYHFRWKIGGNWWEYVESVKLLAEKWQMGHHRKDEMSRKLPKLPKIAVLSCRDVEQLLHILLNRSMIILCDKIKLATRISKVKATRSFSKYKLVKSQESQDKGEATRAKKVKA